MNDRERLEQELSRTGKAEELKKLAQSPQGKRIGEMIDAQTLERAAQRGDGEALQQILTQVLRSEEGKSLAAAVKKLMEKQ